MSQSTQSQPNQHRYERAVEDVVDILKHAKLDKRNLTDISQALFYPDLSDDLDKFVLIELGPYLMREVEEGENLFFKGGLNEKAVLCSDTKTFDIKTAEISNSLLLVPDLKLAQATNNSPLKSPQKGLNRSLNSSNEEELDESEIAARSQPFQAVEMRPVRKIFYEYIECTPIKPRYRKTMDLLQMTRYSGPENEYCVDRKLLFRYKQLLDTAQCSDAEFAAGLRAHRAIEIDGVVRVLEKSYEYRSVRLMLDLVEENSWALDEIDLDVTLAALQGIVPQEVVIGLFHLYTKESEKPGKYRYDEEMVSRIILFNILQPDLKFQLHDFMSTWEEAMPEGMRIDEGHLRGIGVIHRTASPPYVATLLEDEMTTNLADRLKLLFSVKDRWLLEEIEPYIEYFTTPTLHVSAILAKHARSLTENGVRVYVSKH